jgi:hypothetical protein
MIDKIEIATDFNGELYVCRAWENEILIIDQNSDTKPKLQIENGMVTNILHDEIEIKEFEAFEAIESIVNL